MKKFILFVSTVFLSLLFVNNKVHAQEYPEYPSHLMKASYLPFILSPIAENANTYEYIISYNVNAIFYYADEIQYYLIAEDVSFKKGIDRRTNSYEITWVRGYPDLGYTSMELHVTLLKSVVSEYAEPDFPLDPTPLFRYYSALYITYISDTGSIDYDVGYSDGYEAGYDKGLDDGFNNGYDVGYNTGYNYGYDTGHNDGYTEGFERGYDVGIRESQPEVYQRGYDDGYEDGYNDGVKEPPMSFVNNLHVWIVPAIIVVIIAGIFVGYRRERHYDD